MENIKWLIVALVQGVTEFLPISSSGHLMLVYDMFNITQNTLLIAIIFHVATLASVVVYYFKDIVELIRHPFCKTNINILLSMIPTFILAMLFKNAVSNMTDGAILYINFYITALMLIILFVLQCRVVNGDTLPKNTHIMSINGGYMSHNTWKMSQSVSANMSTNLNIKWWQSLLMGLSQGVAVFPGISRSGTTITCGSVCGVDNKSATKFSLLMSIPVIVGSMLFEIIDYINSPMVIDCSMTMLACSFAVCFAVGLLSIKLLQFVMNKKYGTLICAVYLIVLATICFVV